jgi:alginate O-acetyltransferase complex protein AlgI
MNLFIVFLTTGLWHGAALNFVFWGFGHGVLLFIEKTFGKRLGARFKDSIVKKIVSRVYTLCSIMLLWVFFRIGIRSGFNFIKNLFLLNSGSDNISSYIKLFIDIQYYVYLFFAILFTFPWWKKIHMLGEFHSLHIRYIALIVLLVLSICTLATNAYNPFIYFRF